MKRVLFSMLMLLTLIAFNPSLDAAFAADKNTKSTADCCKTTCSSCLKTCEDTLKYCEEQGGKHVAKEHIAALKDCIALCKACTELGSRDSKLLSKLRAVCADACTKCAKSCEALNDPKMKDCVKACNECAQTCKTGGAACKPDAKKS
jgi:hypothetical protein